MHTNMNPSNAKHICMCGTVMIEQYILQNNRGRFHVPHAYLRLYEQLIFFRSDVLRVRMKIAGLDCVW